MCLYAQVFPLGEGSHLAQIKWPAVRVVAKRIFYYAWVLADFYEGVPLAPFVCGASLVFLLSGFMAGARRDYGLAAYGLLCLGLYVLRPHGQGIRFPYPLFAGVRLPGDARHVALLAMRGD